MKIILTILVLFVVFISIAGNNNKHANLQSTAPQASSESMKKTLAAEAKAFKIRNEKREKELAIQQPKLEKLIKSYMTCFTKLNTVMAFLMSGSTMSLTC
jgi:ERCC4-related helicase